MMLQAKVIAPAAPAFWSTAKRFRYQAQDCPLTLRQAADEYLQGHPEVLLRGHRRCVASAHGHQEDSCSRRGNECQHLDHGACQ